MIYIAQTSGKNQGAFVNGSPGDGKNRLKAVSLLRLCLNAISDLHLQSRTEGGKVFRIIGTETRKAHEPKLWLRRVTDDNKMAEDRILVFIICKCKILNNM